MVITQTVDVPADHRLRLDFELPPEFPAGRTVITFTPAPDGIQKTATPVSDRLAGCLAGIGDIDLSKIREERLAKHLA